MGQSKSFRSLMTIIVFLLLLIPSLMIGSIGYFFTFDKIKDLKLQTVGAIAEAKRDQLATELKSTRLRLINFLEVISARCQTTRPTRFDNTCLKISFEQFIKNEAAIAIYLFDADNKKLALSTVGPVVFSEFSRLKLPQIASFSNYDEAESQFYIDAENDQKDRIVAVYPAANIQKIFNTPKALGNTGETFLSNPAGLFITKPRYNSVQGHHNHPISAVPMQKCLAGADTEVLDEDYRAANVIHGFRIVPEIGMGCIMAHTEQAEAFSQLNVLLDRFILAGGAAIILILLLSFFLGRGLTQKLIAPLLNYGKMFEQFQEQKNEIVELHNESHEELKPIHSAFRGLLQSIRTDRGQLLKERIWSDFILANIDDGIVELNTEGKIIEINRKMISLFGFEKKELLNHDLRLFFSESDVVNFETFFNKCLEMFEDKVIDSETFEISARHKNDSPIPVTILIKELIKDNQIIFVGIIKDLGPQMILEQELEQEKTMAIQASKFAALGQITGSIAHEINTPLAALTLSAQNLETLITEDIIDINKVKKHLAMTIRIVANIKTLITSIKKMSRIDPDGAKTCISIHSLIDDVRVVSDAIMRANGVEFQCCYCDDAPDLRVLVNPTQMGQVLMSLISNSIDAIALLSERWIRLEIGKEKQFLVMKLVDSGHGLPDSVAQKIFTPFFTTKRIGKGTGIGLVISKRILEDHNGSLEVDGSALNTTFIIKIPLILNGILEQHN
jgi:PAS domain S-box-containing protein